MDPPKLQGWHADPFGLHEHRYFSAGSPTKLVRDGKLEAYDEPPAEDWVPSLAVAVGDSLTGTGPDGVGFSASPAPGLSLPAPGHIGRRYAVVALIAAAVLCAVLVIGTHVAARAPASATQTVPPLLDAGSGDLGAFVARSGERTLAEHTADITVTGVLEVGRTVMILSGRGQDNLAANTYAITVSGSMAGAAVAEQEIATSRDLYLQLTTGHGVAAHTGSRHWYEFPLGSSLTHSTAPAATLCQNACAGVANPGWLLRVLEQPGARVTAMGTQDTRGPNCTEYFVTPSKQAIRTAAQEEAAELGFYGPQAAPLQQELEKLTPTTLTVWLDPGRQLACQLEATMPVGMVGPAGPRSAPAAMAAQMLVTFTKYGRAAVIKPPASFDTVAFSSVASTAQAARAPGFVRPRR